MKKMTRALVFAVVVTLCATFANVTPATATVGLNPAGVESNGCETGRQLFSLGMAEYSAGQAIGNALLMAKGAADMAWGGMMKAAFC